MEEEIKKACPLCNRKLIRKNEGLVCPNWKCKLYFKCGNGWVLHGYETEAYRRINDFWDTNSRLRFSKEWATLKSIVLKRDNYECQHCKYSLVKDNWYRSKQIAVHHIVPCHKESALYLDEDNCICVCEDCHKILHSADKHKFGGL